MNIDMDQSVQVGCLSAYRRVINPLLAFKNAKWDGVHHNTVNDQLDRIGSTGLEHHTKITVDLIRTRLIVVEEDLYRWRGLHHRAVWSSQAGGKGDFFSARPR